MENRIRSSNIELYRIIVMLLIVAHHYVVNSGLSSLLEVQAISFKSLYFYVFGMWGKIGINCFVLITGYFMCTSTISIRKFLKLLLEVLFYNVVIYAIFVLAGYEAFSVSTLFQRVWIFRVVSDGFTTCFLLFYLFIPFLNKLIHSLERKEHLYLILLSLFIYSIIGSIPSFKVEYSYLTWFFVLYIIASFIRIYDLPIFHKFVGGGTFLIVILTIGSVVVLRYISVLIGSSLQYYLVIDANKILAVICSVALFNYFRCIQIPYNKIINVVASSTFGIYIIHTNSQTMRDWLWKDVVGCVDNYYSTHYMIYSIIWVLLIFVICFLLDQVRIHTVEKWFFVLYDKRYNKQPKRFNDNN